MVETYFEREEYLYWLLSISVPKIGASFIKKGKQFGNQPIKLPISERMCQVASTGAILLRQSAINLHQLLKRSMIEEINHTVENSSFSTDDPSSQYSLFSERMSNVASTTIEILTITKLQCYNAFHEGISGVTPHEMEIATINDPQELTQWLLSQLPADVGALAPELTIDADELLITLNLNTETSMGEGEALKNAERALIEHQRSETRTLRIQLGRHLERTYGCAVSWGMRAGGTVQLFTTNTTAVMTRLSRTERQVLDTLIAANVANTRSAALGYIVRTFAIEHQEWLNQAQEAAKHMTSLREQLQPKQRVEPPPLHSSSHHSETLS